jgi:hypothetical protein
VPWSESIHGGPPNARIGTELNLTFSSVAEYSFLLPALFYKFPWGEKVDAYEAALKKRLLHYQTEDKFQIKGVTDPQKITPLSDLENLSKACGKIDVEARDDGAYSR